MAVVIVDGLLTSTLLNLIFVPVLFEQWRIAGTGRRAPCKRSALYLNDQNKGDHRLFPADEQRSSTTVEAIALDDYDLAGRRVSFIKIDTQGSEGVILEGMLRTLRANRDVELAVEFWPHGLTLAGYSARQLAERFTELGFTQVSEISESRQSVERTSFFQGADRALYGQRHQFYERVHQSLALLISLGQCLDTASRLTTQSISRSSPANAPVLRQIRKACMNGYNAPSNTLSTSPASNLLRRSLASR